MSATPKKKMRMLFVWTGLNGYMGDCWRELAGRSCVDLRIVVDTRNKYYGGGFCAEEVMRDLPWGSSFEAVVHEVELCGWKPDVVFIVGWRNEICREALRFFSRGKSRRKEHTKPVLVCCFDMPWEWRIRKFMARFVLWRYLRKFDAAFVSGELSEKYAMWLGYKRDDIYKGLFSTDCKRFGEHIGGRGFLYVGRNAPEKGLDALREAYRIYRNRGGKWGLRIVSDVSPNDVARYYSKADCFVLASRREPWGVVLVEAAAAGLPIICTDKCGARFEVVKDNGFVVRSGKPEELAEAMLKVEKMSMATRLGLGEKGKALAKSYSCEAWADRVVSLCEELVNA